MRNNAIAVQDAPEPNIRIIQPSAVSVMEQVIIKGNLAELQPEDRVRFYLEVCQSIGVNPLTQPFGYFDIDGQLTLYAKKDCTDQLRKIHDVTVKIISRELVDGVYVVTAQAISPNGRTDESIGAVPLVKEGGEWKTAQQSGKRYFAGDGTFKPIGPDARANAIMKAETKAKRRVTLSLVGLGLLDESELAQIPNARIVDVDSSTGKITGSKPVAIESGLSPKTDETPSTTNNGARLTDWSVMYKRADQQFGIKGAEAFVKAVGQPIKEFGGDPQAAFDALCAAMGAGTEPAPDDPDMIDIDGQQVDTSSGEIVDQAPAPETKATKKPVAEFGKPEQAVAADRYTG